MEINELGKYERFVSPSFWFGAKNGVAHVRQLALHCRQVWKYFWNLQQNMLFLIKSNSKATLVLSIFFVSC